MKTLSIYIGIIGMLLLAVLPVRAASEAEFRKLSKTYTLRADGSQEMRVQKELTLFTHAAMNGLYGETFIVYNPDFQKLEIHASYTRQKDGTVVQTPANAFVEVLPAAAANRVGGKRSSFLPTFVFRPLTPPYMRFRIRRFLFWVPFEVRPY